MQTYELLVKNRAVKANSRDMSLVRTSVGIDQVHVLFDDEEWINFPVTITFAQGDSCVTQSLAISRTESSEWTAEATVVVPPEVTDKVGPVRVTLQGTDSEGRHIITAKGAPFTVEEAGDVVTGDPPSDAPSTDQWQQAYSDAVAAANDARSLLSDIESRIDSIVAEARADIQGMVDSVLVPATTGSLGVVQVGDNLSVDENGVLSANVPPPTEVGGLTSQQLALLYNLQLLATYAFDSEFTDGVLQGNVRVKESALPVASAETAGVVKVDGITVAVDEDGMAYVPYITHSWDGTKLTIQSASGTSTADLVGPPIDIVEATGTVDQTIGDPSVTVTVGGEGAERTFHFEFSGIRGEVGPQGIQGPAGYVFTDEDYATVVDSVVERIGLYDTTGF